MISPVTQFEQNKPNPFDNFSAGKNGYWLMPENKQTNGQNNALGAIDPKYILLPDEARKTNNSMIIGLSIAGVTVLTFAGLFFFLKGSPKGVQKYFQNLRAQLVQKLQKSRLENAGKLTELSKVNIYLIKTLDIFLKRFEATNNFGTFKDLLFKNFMYRIPYGRKAHDYITALFGKIGSHSVRSRYNGTSALIERLAGLSRAKLIGSGMDNPVIINGQKMTKAEALNAASQMCDELIASYTQNFGRTGFQNRYVKFDKVLEKLKLSFESLKVFWSKHIYSDFIADNALLEERTKIQNLVRANRKALSYSYRDMASEIDTKIMDITSKLKYKDADTIKQLRAIRTKIKKFVKNPQMRYDLKPEIIKDLEMLQKEITPAADAAPEIIKLHEEVIKDITGIKDGFSNFNQGKVQNILDIYRKVLQPEEYAAVEKTFNTAITSLDKSIKVETDDYISKLRDLALGSAPTDILSAVGSLGVLGYQLGKSKDKEQRQSIALKYGIPAVAGIGTMLYFNAKLYAGTKSMLLSAAASFALNRIGEFSDNLLKKHRKNQVQQEQAPVR